MNDQFINNRYRNNHYPGNHYINYNNNQYSAGHRNFDNGTEYWNNNRTNNDINPVIEVERRIYLDTKKTIESLDPMMATQEPLRGTIVRRIGWKTKYSSGSIK